MARALREGGLSEGVLGFVSNAPEQGHAVAEALIAYPPVRRVNFTGSTRVGRQIAQARALAIVEQDKTIKTAAKSMEESRARVAATEAKGAVVQAEEDLATLRQLAEAERRPRAPHRREPPHRRTCGAGAGKSPARGAARDEEDRRCRGGETRLGDG